VETLEEGEKATRKMSKVGAVNVERRVWETGKYEQRAKERAEYGDDHVEKKELASVRKRPEFQAAEPGAEGPAGSKRSFLKAREGKLKLDALAGKSRVLTEAEARERDTGWYCDVCECLLRDSSSYLDHINGIKHQRKLGFSMRIERVGVDVVRERFATVGSQIESKRKREQELRRTDETTDDIIADWEQRTQRNEDQLHRDKRQKKKDEKKRQKKKQVDDLLPTPEQQEDNQDLDDDDEAAAMNAMMGFGNFGGSKKKK